MTFYSVFIAMNTRKLEYFYEVQLLTVSHRGHSVGQCYYITIEMMLECIQVF